MARKKAATTTTSSTDWMSALMQMETTLNVYFGQKAPRLPKGITNFFVWIAPYWTILGVIVTFLAVVPLTLVALGMTAVLAPFMYNDVMWNWGFSSIVGLIGMILTLVLSIQAIPGLFKRQMGAWRKLFWMSLISIVTTVASMNLFGAAIGAIINWYILFQMRAQYK